MRQGGDRQDDVEGRLGEGKLSHVSAGKIDGRRALGVRGTATSSGGTVVDTVYAQAAGSPLPVKHVTTRGARNVTTTHFTDWNGRVAVLVPKKSVPVSVIRKAFIGVA